MNPLLEKYLKDKIGASYDPTADVNINNQAANASAFGDVLAGRQVGSQDQYFANLNKQALDKSLNEKKSALEDYSIEKTMKSDLDKNDKTSESAKFAQDSLVQVGFSPELVKNKSLNELESLSPYTKMIIDKQRQEQERKFKQEENQLKRQELGNKRQELQQLRIEEKQNQLQTPFGLAQTPDDAKQLKAASEEKSSFDNMIDELIDLRSKKGGEMLDRDAVSRAQQLSKKLLLSYKNMSKLGVLSQADEAIINAIIPPDPLEFRSPLAAVQGQDPILNNLKKFKEDSNFDFQQKLMNRLRQPDEALKARNTPQTKEVNGQMYQKTSGGWQKIKKEANNGQ
jgi:hypothetical protein